MSALPTVCIADGVVAQERLLRRHSGIEKVAASRWRLNGRVEQALAGYPEGMDRRRVRQKRDQRTVPGTGGPGPNEASVEGQKALRLHAGIAAIAVVLSAFVTWIFVRLGLVPLAVGFGVVAAICLVILGWALYRKRRGEQKQ
jgi:Flp pilus assembly protein TadB